MALKKIKYAEKTIVAVWGILVRHWGKLIVLSILTIAIWFGYLVYIDMDHDHPDEEYFEYPEYDDEITPQEYNQQQKG